MMLETILILTCILVVVLGYTTINLLRKVEKLEEIIERYDFHLKELSTQIELSDVKLKEIDLKESFKSDDEIGWFFDQVKIIQESISKFKFPQS